MAVKPPPCVWAQRKDRVFITVELMGCSCEVSFEDEKILFVGKGKKAGEEGDYSAVFDLWGQINKEESTYRVTDRCVEIVGKKKEEGPYWDKLLKQPAKLTKHWLGTNWALYIEEEDEDDAANAKAEGAMTGRERLLGLGRAYGEAFCSGDKDTLMEMVSVGLKYETSQGALSGEAAARKLWWTWQDVLGPSRLKLHSVDLLRSGAITVKLDMGEIRMRDRLWLDEKDKITSITRDVGEDSNPSELERHLQAESERLQRELNETNAKTKTRLLNTRALMQKVTTTIAFRTRSPILPTPEQPDQRDDVEVLKSEIEVLKESQVTKDKIYNELLRKKDEQHALTLAREEAHVARLRKKVHKMYEEMEGLIANYKEQRESSHTFSLQLAGMERQQAEVDRRSRSFRNDRDGESSVGEKEIFALRDKLKRELKNFDERPAQVIKQNRYGGTKVDTLQKGGGGGSTPSPRAVMNSPRANSSALCEGDRVDDNLIVVHRRVLEELQVLRMESVAWKNEQVSLLADINKRDKDNKHAKHYSMRKVPSSRIDRRVNTTRSTLQSVLRKVGKLTSITTTVVEASKKSCDFSCQHNEEDTLSLAGTSSTLIMLKALLNKFHDLSHRVATNPQVTLSLADSPMKTPATQTEEDAFILRSLCELFGMHNFKLKLALVKLLEIAENTMITTVGTQTGPVKSVGKSVNHVPHKPITGEGEGGGRNQRNKRKSGVRTESSNRNDSKSKSHSEHFVNDIELSAFGDDTGEHDKVVSEVLVSPTCFAVSKVYFCYVCGAGPYKSDTKILKCKTCSECNPNGHEIRRLIGLDRRAMKAKEVGGSRQKKQRTMLQEKQAACFTSASDVDNDKLPPLHRPSSRCKVKNVKPTAEPTVELITEQDRDVYNTMHAAHGEVSVTTLRAMPVMEGSLPNILTASAAREVLHHYRFRDTHNITLPEFAGFSALLQAKVAPTLPSS